MSNPIIADNKPVKVNFSKDKEYHFCTCGKSSNQPFCNGSHVGTSFTPKTVESLKKAAQLDKDSARFSYVYAIAIGEKDPKKAIEILEKAYPKHTGDLQIVSGLAYYYKQIGDTKKSEMYEKKLKELQNFSVR